MVVRAMRVELYGFGKASGQRDNWRQLAVDCQRMTNRLWQIWLVHHSINGSADKLRAHFDAYKQWQETKRGDKPEWPCKALEKPLTVSADSRSFYRILSAEFPNVNVRTRGLLTNAWQSRLSKRKAANGNLPGWVSILFANESLPSFTRPQPIPFDHDNAKLMKDAAGRYIVEVRVERLADGKSVVERCELMLRKRKAGSLRAIMDRILSGEFKWKGSNLLFDRGKWYAVLSYEKPVRERVALDAEKVLYIRPARKAPWMVRMERGTFGFGGNGSHVEFARRAILRERSQRKEHYRWGGSNQKGHGRLRAAAVWTKLSSRWKDFVKRYNNEITRRIVDMAVRSGCGRIVYLQPKEQQRDSRFLSTAGNTDDSSMSWDYFQFGTLLASKCEEEGIEYGAKPKAAKKNKTTSTSDSLRNVRQANGAIIKQHTGNTPASMR